MKDLLRMSELAGRSGVPAATIKHYLREGLLPGPAKRTGRTMAYYHPSLVARVKAIKELQTQRYLPLNVIREVLDGADPYRTDETELALERALQESAATTESRTREELLAGGMPAAELDFFESVGLVKADGDEHVYRGDDLAILRTLASARRAGLSPEMLPHTIVGPYLEAIQALARAELAMFREGMLAAEPDADVESLVEAANGLSERLVVLLRRKTLVPMLRRLAAEQRDATEEQEDTP